MADLKQCGISASYDPVGRCILIAGTHCGNQYGVFIDLDILIRALIYIGDIDSNGRSIGVAAVGCLDGEDILLGGFIVQVRIVGNSDLSGRSVDRENAITVTGHNRIGQRLAIKIGVIAGVGLLYGLLFVCQPLILTRFGLLIAIGGLSTYELILMGVVCLAGCLIGMIPGYQIYRYSLADGMTIRI